MSLKSKLDNLKKEDRRRLMHAFDNHITQYVALDNNEFVGVYIDIENFKITEQVGVWSTGKVVTHENLGNWP